MFGGGILEVNMGESLGERLGERVRGWIFGEGGVVPTKTGLSVKLFLSFINLTKDYLKIFIFNIKIPTRMSFLEKIDVPYKEHLTIKEDSNHIKWVSYTFDNISKHVGSWENHVFTTIKKILDYTMGSFIDVGSNIGYHSIRISKLGYKVYSIEPNPELNKILSLNSTINKLEQFTIFNCALSKPNTMLYTEPLPYSFNLGDLPLKEQRGSIEIPTVEFDRLCESINMKDVRVVKIDVSGHELNVLYGMITTLVDHRPYIILPLESQVCIRNGYTCEHVVNLLGSFKYKCIEIENEYPCDHLFYPEEKYKEIKEIFNVREKTTTNNINNNLDLGVCLKINPFEDKIYEVQLLCGWTTSEDICRTWEKMKPKGSKLSMVSKSDVDYTVIVNRPPQGSVYNPEKTMVFRMEPDCEENFSEWFKSKNSFMRFFSLNNYRNNTEWHLGKTYQELMDETPKKTKVLSTVLSGLYTMEGHKLRVDFVRYLENNDVEIDVYGRDNDSNFKNYICSLPYHQKDEAILPYKYTFIAENCDMKNYFTEKIIDPILGETLCFYWGCSGLENYIDSRAFIRLPLHDKQESKRILLEAIANDEWSKRIDIIRKEKKKILDYYSFYNRVELYLDMDIRLEIKVVGSFSPEEYVEFNNNVIIYNIKNISPQKVNDPVNTNKDILYIPSCYKLKDGFNDSVSILYRKLLKTYPDFKVCYITDIYKNVELSEISEDIQTSVKIVSGRGGSKIIKN